MICLKTFNCVPDRFFMGVALGIDVFLALAIVLLVAGIIGSVVPAVPGAFFSIIGLLLYWWSTGFTAPSTLFMGVALTLGVFTLLFDYFAGAVSAKIGGASVLTTLVAALVGVVLLLVAGPIGILVGVAGTVFLVEFWRTERVERSAKAALYATIGMLGSVLVQLLLTTALLVGFLFTVFL